MAGPLRPYPPSLELNGRWEVGALEKKVLKKVIFSLMVRPLPSPTLLLLAWPLREERFFCGFPYLYTGILEL